MLERVMQSKWSLGRWLKSLKPIICYTCRLLVPKHYNKIIFKCVNSAVWSIFKEKKVFVSSVNNARNPQKLDADAWTWNAIQTKLWSSIEITWAYRL